MTKQTAKGRSTCRDYKFGDFFSPFFNFFFKNTVLLLTLFEMSFFFSLLQLKELYTLLNENYVEDDDNMFRFDYSPAFLLW